MRQYALVALLHTVDDVWTKLVGRKSYVQAVPAIGVLRSNRAKKIEQRSMTIGTTCDVYFRTPLKPPFTCQTFALGFVLDLVENVYHDRVICMKPRGLSEPPTPASTPEQRTRGPSPLAQPA